MKPMFTSLMLAGSLLAGGQAMAGDLLQWQNNSLTYLWGKRLYRQPADPANRHLRTRRRLEVRRQLCVRRPHLLQRQGRRQRRPEHLLRRDQPAFVIRQDLRPEDLSFGPIKDVLLAMTYEFGEGDNESYLIGPGFDLNIPGFDYFQLNFYQRQTEGNRPGDSVWQITPVWSYTIPVGNSDILIDGFMDWVVDNDKNARGTYHANLHFNPQVKYDLGKALTLGRQAVVCGCRVRLLEEQVRDRRYRGVQDDSETRRASWSSIHF